MIAFRDFKAAHDIPDIYWNVHSSEQRIKEICRWLAKVSDYEDYLSDELGLAQEDIITLQEIAEKIENGDYTEQYIDGLIEYFDNYIVPMIGRLIKYVYPGLIWDGNAFRFAFQVPEEWDFLKFGWEYDEKDTTYHIVLNFADEHVETYHKDIDIMKAHIRLLEKKLKALQKEVVNHE